MKAVLKIVTLSSIAILAGCGGAAVNTTNMANSAMKSENLNAQSAMVNSMVDSTATNTNVAAPGIPTVIANMPKGATPTPGIPSPEEMKKPVKKGATPTPGIPSPDEIRKQMGGAVPPSAVNDPAQPSDTMMKKDGGSMMKKNSNKLPMKP